MKAIVNNSHDFDYQFGAYVIPARSFAYVDLDGCGIGAPDGTIGVNLIGPIQGSPKPRVGYWRVPQSKTPEPLQGRIELVYETTQPRKWRLNA